MRILIATPYAPWPVSSGGNAAQFSTLKCLKDDHEFTLLSTVWSDSDLASAAELQRQLPTVKIRPVYCGSARPARVSKSRRFLRSARSLERRMKAALASALSPAKRAPNTVEPPRYPFHLCPPPFVAALDEEMAKGVDLFQAEFVDMLPLGSWIPSELPKLFVHHQIHYVYNRRHLECHPRQAYLDYLASIMRVQEEAYLKCFDKVITFSDIDRQALLPFLPPENVVTSPFPIPSDVGLASRLAPRFDGRFLFIASQDHLPNQEGLEWLLKETWPRIQKKLPSSRLVVIGDWSAAAQTRLARPNLEFTGFVRDLSAVLPGGIMLVPLRVGSGIRVKILVAMAQGAPVVSTSVGCEGIAVKDGEDILVGDTPEQFAAAAVRLAAESELWRRVAAAGRDTVEATYAPEMVRRHRNEIYASLMEKHGAMPA